MRGDGRVFWRGKFWWIAYYRPDEDGRSVETRESTKSIDREIAERRLRDRVREVANHRKGVRSFAGPVADRITVDEIIDDLHADYAARGIKSLDRRKREAKDVRAYFGHHRAMTVTPKLVRQFIEAEQKKKRRNSTINRKLEALSAAYRLAIRENKITRQPHIPHLSEVGNARRGFFERDEHEAIIAKLPKPIDDMARFAYVCGWRQTECRLLRWESVDRAAREVRLHDSKNAEGRVLPLEGEMWEMFERLWRERTFRARRGTALSDYVFHRKGKPVDATTFAEEWRAARTAAEVGAGRIFHDYRRTAARNMIRSGVGQAVAMAITGHKTDSMFRRYNITTTDDMRAAMRKVQADAEHGHERAKTENKALTQKR